ncbi:MAG TPA: hypothetical protein VMN38_11785 [Sphingomicrobium sp.]|nr:hypothetical protein [Sphingomicrobium sp.]
MAARNLPRSAPATIGLERFAAAWVDRWLANGGSVAVDAEGKAWFFAVVSSRDAPGYVPPPEDWPESLLLDRLHFEDAMLCGRTRELSDLLDTVTGGRDAVKEHVFQFPSHVYRDGRRDVA